jgi:N-acetylmuramoyl-L-alanine amidase
MQHPSTLASVIRRALQLVVLGAVVLSVVGLSAHSTPATAYAATAAEPARQFVVAIDAGHQSKADTRLEPIGPGSSKRKPRVAGGTRGVATRKRESTINLQVALKLRKALEKRGVKVVMIRTKQDVNISNSKRAKIANAVNADLCIRLHCDGSPNKSVRGVLTIVPAKNKWTQRITAASLRAGKDVHKATLKATGAKDRGISKRGDMTGFNWSKVPVVIVEMGVMTNAAEDRKLASKSYQTKLVNGMTKGIMIFLER